MLCTVKQCSERQECQVWRPACRRVVMVQMLSAALPCVLRRTQEVVDS
jgi:hypothetical protein